MKRLWFLWLAGLIFCSCTTRRSEFKLSQFRYNDKLHNNWIIRRIPEYGNGNRDGCIIKGEFSIVLHSNDLKSWYGKVLDVESLKPLAGSTVQLLDYSGNTVKKVYTDSAGNFNFEQNNKKISKLQIDYIGYISFKADLDYLN